MTNNEDSLNTLKIDLFISEQHHHHHAFEILNTYSDFSKKFSESLNKDIKITFKPNEAKTKSKKTINRINAKELNIVIRKLLTKNFGLEIKFEVFEENGVFYFSAEKSAIGGFDFAILNHYNNILALRNLCYGNLQYADGELRWEKFLSKNPDLREIANEFAKIEDRGQDLIFKQDKNKHTPLIVGEIQFGNWGLAYRDFFKVLKANVQNSVDCLIYLVPTGNLENMLSDGIVTFDKTKKILDEFLKVISVPVWLIGLDVKMPEENNIII